MRSTLLALGSIFVSATALAQDSTVASPEPPPEAVVAVLPFEPSLEPNRIYVDLAPEGQRPFVLMLDTGAQHSVLTPSTARALGVTVRRTKTSPYRKATRLGRDLHFFIDTSRGDVGSRTGFEYGLLGGNFLEHYVVELDFANRRVRLLDPDRYEVPRAVSAPDEAVMKMRVTAKRPFVSAEIDGRPLQVLLDTGAPLPFLVSGRSAKRAGLDLEMLGTSGELVGTVGFSRFDLAEARSWSLASLSFDDAVPVVFTEKGFYNVAGNTDSVIGYDLLQPFTLRLDYPRSRIWLKRRADARITFGGADYELARRTGAFLAPLSEGYAVLMVLPDTPAARIGLQEGDLITSAAFDALPTIEQTIGRIEAGDEILVARRQDEDAWVDISLGTPSAPSRPVAADEPTDEEREAARVKQRGERMYVFENGGWMAVDGYRLRLGPKEGETWVTYEEMLALREQQAGAR